MPLEWDLLVFLFISAVAIGAALAVVWSKEVVRSVVFLALVFLCIGFTFVFLNAEYLAVVQIMIYVGAVSVLMLFGIMLTKRRLLGGDRCE